MYAVEEYGKAILLKNAITGNKDKYQIDGWILGIGKPNQGTAHDKKMRVGFDNLPEDCRIFMRGIKVTEDLTSAKIETEALTSAKSITIKRGKQRYDKVSVPKSTTGSFFDTTNVNIFDYNLDLKTACFYIDWDRDNWKYDAAMGPEDLKKNIKCLEDALAKAGN
jgi:hypothetical protein